MSSLRERNSVRKVMAEKDQRLEELTKKYQELLTKYNDVGSEYDSIRIRYEDEVGREWDGRVFRE